MFLDGAGAAEQKTSQCNTFGKPIEGFKNEKKLQCKHPERDLMIEGCFEVLYLLVSNQFYKVVHFCPSREAMVCCLCACVSGGGGRGITGFHLPFTPAVLDECAGFVNTKLVLPVKMNILLK